MAVVAAHVGRRRPREQFPADYLRIRLEQAKAVAMTVTGELLLTQIGERRLELDVAGEQLVGGTHRRVPDVVTDTRERSEPNEIAATQLCPGATDVLVVGMIVRQAHLVPDLQDAARCVAPSLHVVLKRGVVEEIELDQLDPRVLEIEQRSILTATVSAHVLGQRYEPCGLGGRVPGRPVVGPIDPRCGSERQRVVTSPAGSRGRLDLAEEALDPGGRDGSEPTLSEPQARAYYGVVPHEVAADTQRGDHRDADQEPFLVHGASDRETRS